MEVLEKQIQEFLKVDYGSGDGYGSGFSSGSGDGYGDGYGSGCGSGFSSGYGDGYGSGFSSGYGYGYGDGDGYSSGSGEGVLSINNQKVYLIDGVQTIITKIRNNIAKGFILKSDLTLQPCYVVKANNLFAHGKDLKEAMQSLQNKLFEDLSEEERIDLFIAEFEKDKKYKGHVFFDWHKKLTGSCLMGRETFVENNGLSLDDEYTVDEFIKLTKNSYGSDIIRELEKKINKG
jgi:hypothetical protein